MTSPLNIVVTGASGLLGRAVVQECTKRGHNGMLHSYDLFLAGAELLEPVQQSKASPIPGPDLTSRSST